MTPSPQSVNSRAEYEPNLLDKVDPFGVPQTTITLPQRTPNGPNSRPGVRVNPVSGVAVRSPDSHGEAPDRLITREYVFRTGRDGVSVVTDREIPAKETFKPATEC